ncbi:MAG: hypothetical protein JRH20_29385 [Deltaproteobacteria bacterium]|nr:hypothetical protein [Deltaproteobacteria bacterium]
MRRRAVSCITAHGGQCGNELLGQRHDGGSPGDRFPTREQALADLIKNYQSLIPLAEDARKPIFKLTAADGA